MTESRSLSVKAVLLFCVAAAPLVIQAQGPVPELPVSPITPKVKTACLECHDSGIIVQQRLNRKMWGREVDKMVRWGALVDAVDQDAFVNYFVANFGSEKPPAAPQYKFRVDVGKPKKHD